MSAAILILLFIATVFFPKSKLLYWIIVVYMWLLFSFNTGAPDTGTYEWIYNDNITGAFEPLFTAIMALCRLLCLSFVGFRMVIATLILFFLHLAFRYMAEYKTLAMAMYMIAPFLWQISGIRAGLACAVLVYALTVFIQDIRKNKVKYIVFWGIATLIHYSSILFIVMLLVKKEDFRKRLITYIIFAIVGTMIVQHTNILFMLVSKFTDREKILTWLSGGLDKEGYPNWKGFTAELIILFGNIFFTNISKRIISRHDITGKKAKLAKAISDLNVISVLFIPLLRLNDTYIRLLLIMHGINIVLYSMTAFFLQENYTMPRIRQRWIVPPRTRFSLYALVVPLWTYIIAIYQNLPYFGTPQSVLLFIGKNSMFY